MYKMASLQTNILYITFIHMAKVIITRYNIVIKKEETPSCA